MVNIIDKQLEVSFDEEIALTSLAKELGYSKFHITKRFKSFIGMNRTKQLWFIKYTARNIWVTGCISL
jgi:AraC-like DNA-binding protein